MGAQHPPAAVVPELLLVRDCLHCCQGGQGGRYVQYSGGEAVPYDVVEEYREDVEGGTKRDSVVPLSQRQLIWKITKVGGLVRRITECLNGEQKKDSIVHDAIRSACHKEIRSCYRVIAVLEGQSHGVGKGEGSQALTLRRTLVWLDETRQRLEIVASCLDAVQTVGGGEALNVLYSLSQHGDSFVVQTIASLLDAASAPYFMQLEQWITHGVIPGVANLHQLGRGQMMSSRGVKDIMPGQRSGEFMITKLRTPKDHPYDDWKDGFTLDKAAQPSCMRGPMANDILSVGKQAYFLRKYCDDEQEWNDAVVQLQHAGQLTRVGSDFSAEQRMSILSQLIEESKQVMGEKLLHVIREKEHMFEHLENIKRYVLLSKGDFVRIFIDLADEDLSVPVESYSEYTLQGHVEKALQTCGAVDIGDRGLLDNIKVQRVQEHQYTAATDIGWNVFGLGYALAREDSPAAVLLDPASMNTYGEISSILWSMKRAEHISGLTWHRLDAIARDLNRLRSMEREYGIDAASIVGAVPLLMRYLHALRAEISQFVNTLQSHIVYRVIEPAWKKMLSDMMVAKDLDGLLESHAAALKKISKGTFTDRKKTKSVTSDSNESRATLRAALGAAMDVHIPVENLSATVGDTVDAHCRHLAKVRESERLGIWNEDEVRQSPPSISEETVEEIKRSAVQLYGIFSRHRDMFFANLPSSMRENICR